MAAGVDPFRKLACSLPDAVESAHMGHPDFRVGGRIFATLSGQERWGGVLKLTVERQAEFVAEVPGSFEPVPGGLGAHGDDVFLLDYADESTMRGAFATAHRNVASKPAAGKKAKPAKKRAR